jgi:hypothetical protein
MAMGLLNRPRMPGAISGYGGGTFDMNGQQVTPPDGQGFGMSAAAPRMQQQPQQQRQGRHGFMHTVGRIGDALALLGGRDPIYSTMNAQDDARLAEQETQAALEAYAANPNDQGSFATLLMRNPQLALQIRSGLTGEAYTLGEGQTRYQGNQVIARGPDKGPEITVIDGVAFDQRTGQPLFESPYERIISGTEGAFYSQPRIGYGRQPGAQPAAGQVAGGGIPRVNSPQEAMRLPPGTQFQMPDGRVGTVPGGAGGNSSGTFR